MTEAPLEVMNKAHGPAMTAIAGDRACRQPVPVAAEAAVAVGVAVEVGENC